MKEYKDFVTALEAFFQQYLIKERGMSAMTIRAYGKAFKTYLKYNKVMGIKPNNVSLKDFDRLHILNFLNWLENENGNSVSSRNQRLSAMRSFANYLIMDDPCHIAQWSQIRTIPAKKTSTEIICHLSFEGIVAILEQVDTSTSIGRRNLTLLSLLYNSGARVQELINLSSGDIRFTNPCTIILHGKGNKKRMVPIDEPITKLIKSYLEETKLNRPGQDKHPLFYNARGGRLSTPGVTYILCKYANMARIIQPDLIPPKISPHVFRHSRAMHLLQGGTPLIYIRDFLGHVSIQTTEIYARVSTKQKNEAIANAYQDLGIQKTEAKLWEGNSDILRFLDELCSK